VLRAVILARNQAWDLFSTLDIVDQRSLIRLLDRGAVRQLWRSERAPALEEFLTAQRFLQNPEIVGAVSRRLQELAADTAIVGRACETPECR
jgi:hypothetical protein